MSYWLGFVTGATVVTVICAIWYIAANKLIEVTFEEVTVDGDDHLTLVKSAIKSEFPKL